MSQTEIALPSANVAMEAVPSEAKIASAEASIELPKASDKIARLSSWAVTDPNQLNPAFFSFKDISCVLKVDRKPKVLLDLVSGYCKPGESLAIMGPSGAGKSTLLDILAFRKTTGKWTQDVRLNGAPLTKRSFVQQSGYVTSDDLLTPELTAIEMLRFGAALRLPKDYSEAQREARIRDVLEVMRLTYCENRRIGSALQRGLSTGERKRLNVAMELLPVVSVLFLDEPTTGLDSNTGREIIANVIEVTRLRKLACVATIHQPSYTILSQFDYLLLLAQGKSCYYGRVADAILYFESLGITVAGNPAEIYADAMAAQPDRLIEAWEASDEKNILSKKVEAIHSGQGSINEVVARVEEPSFADRLGFYQNAPLYIQFWQLLKRQMLVYFRNPVMSLSRLIAAVVVGLFFGGAFWQLPRTIGGYANKATEGFAVKLMVPGFGSAAIAYWLEKRKQYYHEESAGYYHRFAHIVVMFFVEWLFISAIMSVAIGIMLPMSGWLSSNIGRYIGYMICEAFASTAINMLCAYAAASIPYANSLFTLHYYYSILLGAWYITDQFLFFRHPSVKAFWQWFSYTRLWFVTSIRDEFSGQPCTCNADEAFSFDLTGINVRSVGGAAKNYTLQAGANSPSIVGALNSFGLWSDAPAAVNSSINQFWQTALGVQTLEGALLIARGANNPPSVINNLQTIATVARGLYAQAAGIPPTDAAAVNRSIELSAAAASMMGYANFLAANPIPNSPPTCFYPNGDAVLQNYVAFDWFILGPGGATDIIGFGIDHFRTTSTGFYMGVAFITGAGWFLLAYLSLWLCNFRQK
ncbi:hypothetical protein DFJ74DRAFT_389544 [Hyaloraphidium curvatum]|nr:hypothetical protein DFJ74DRAFT_389544 [Hyaloraphidium curvatum]